MDNYTGVGTLRTKELTVFYDNFHSSDMMMLADKFPNLRKLELDDSRSATRCLLFYRVSHLLVCRCWVDFDLGVPPSCPAAQLPSCQATSAKFPERIPGRIGKTVWSTQYTSQPNPGALADGTACTFTGPGRVTMVV